MNQEQDPAQVRQTFGFADGRPEVEWQVSLLSLMATTPRLQRQCACGAPSAAGGSCATCEEKTSLQGLQRKPLVIGAPDDPLEREADLVVERVMAAPMHSSANVTSPVIRCFAKQDGGPSHTAPASVNRVIASAGRPLEPALRQDMEQRFGHDFSKVQIHTGTEAERSARDVNAFAYTVGHKIVFGTGQFSPETHHGRRLLAHELAHTVQQSEGLRRQPEPYSRRPDWSSISYSYEMIPDPIERMERMRADSERIRWQNALKRLQEGELDDTDLTHDMLRNRLTGLRKHEVSGLIDKIKSFQAQRDRDILDPTAKDPGKKIPVTTSKIIEWLEVRKVISTPMPDKASVNSLLAGMIDSYSVSTDNVTITVMPDERSSIRDATKLTTNFKGKFQWDVIKGKIANLKKDGASFNPSKLEVTILTTYKDSPDDTSGYGKGTTDSDKYNQTTTLRVHEGQHGADYIDYLTNNPLPVSIDEGINGKLTPGQFEQVLNYVNNITKESCEKTDQSGFSQDEFLKTQAGKESGIKSCRKH